METDSRFLINVVKGDVRNEVWCILPLLEEISKACCSFREVRWNWINLAGVLIGLLMRQP
ncbi:hypothetical protein GBA52_016811 [Prunus armeniaca]|nr:hypothetical protein GBA52_016811 [Prunus armeniaca]